MKVNVKNLYTYRQIFGTEKLLFLWHEYLEQSTATWNNISSHDWDQQRTHFHNWRSSSMVFGLEDFAVFCSKIEENILKKRFNNLANQINECKKCYNESILQITPIIKQMETSHEK